MIEFTCECGKSYVVKDESAGRRGKCKECGAPITVPTPAAKKALPTHGKPRKPARVPTPAAQKGAASRAGPSGSMPWDGGPEKKLSKLEDRCGPSPIYLMVAARSFFKGQGTAEFREDMLRVRGTLSPDPFETIVYWIVAVVVGNFVVAVIPIRVVIDWGPPIFNIACVGYLIYQLVTDREMKALFVRPEKVKSVVCEGPIVTIKCKVDLAPGLNVIRMFIAPRFRKAFFRDFDKLFPNMLPESYRAAAERVREAESPEDTEY